MPTTPPVNTQQVLQMGTHTEKLQHTMQTQPTVVAQQVDKERQLADELKRRQVQGIWTQLIYWKKQTPIPKPKSGLESAKKIIPIPMMITSNPLSPKTLFEGK